LIDPWGLIAVSFYDGSDQGGVRRADGWDFQAAAASTGSIWSFNVQSLEMIEYALWLVKEGFGYDIDDVYIFDHGAQENDFWSEHRQEIGNENPEYSNSGWIAVASHIDPQGTIHLRGCGVATDYAGRNYIMNFAHRTRRKVTAFDRNVIYDDEVSESLFGMPTYYSYGNLWQAERGNRPRIISEGGWYRELHPWRRR